MVWLLLNPKPEAVTFEPLLMLSTRSRPDCVIENDVFSRKDLPRHGSSVAWAASASTRQVPSTEAGALSPRPDFSTPASPSTGKPTRSTDAASKLSFGLRDIFAEASPSRVLNSTEFRTLGGMR